MALILLWLLGVPLSLIIILFLLGVGRRDRATEAPRWGTWWARS